MSAVLGKEECTADEEETEQHESCSRRKKVSLSLTVMLCVIVHRHRTLLFRNQAAAEHAHRAGKPIFAGLLGQQFHRHRLAGRQLGAFLEISKYYLV